VTAVDPERYHKVKHLCLSALGLEKGARESHLAEACEGDESLRQEVQSLLALQKGTGGFLEDEAIKVAARGLARDPSWGSGTDLSGQRLGHYQIEGKIGEGGMGVVFRARDLHLDRFVAIKVLPLEFAADARRLRRFVREAKAASAVNHPNIATIYEIGESEGHHWIAMELVEGETLAGRLKRSALDTATIFDIGIQVCEGLGKAHGKGVIHRDIKPANIMLTPDGQVKLLDFGLAKISPLEGQAVISSVSEPPTLPGFAMGTAGYMSPEQILGQTVDRRSDIFSLGVVLYEMVTGQPPFRGTSLPALLDSIVHQTPVWPSQERNAVSEELKRIIGKALEKFREMRYDTASDLCADLKRLKLNSTSTSIAAGEKAVEDRDRHRAPSRAARIAGKRLIWGLAGLLAFPLSYTLYRFLHSPVSPPTEEVLTAVPFTAYPGNEFYPSFSPDGSQIAFLWNGDKQEGFGVYVKLIGIEPPLHLTDNIGSEAVWSPDGRWIAFFRGTAVDQLALVLASPIPGPERVVTELRVGGVEPRNTSPPMLSWSADSKWVAFYAAEADAGLPAIFILNVETLEKRRLTTPPEDSAGDSGVAFSPDGRSLAFCRATSWGNGELHVLRLSEDLKIVGDPLKIASKGKVLGLDWTPDSRSLVVSVLDSHGTNLWRVELSGSHQPKKLTFGANGFQPTISRRGNRLAYAEQVGDINLWRLDLLPRSRKVRVPHRIVASTRTDSYPQFSPDGSTLSFVSDRTGTNEIWTCGLDGSNQAQLTSLKGVMISGRPRWSPDGSKIAFEGYAEGSSSIYVTEVRTGFTKRRLTSHPAGPANPSWSLDGRWILFDTPNVGIQKMPVDGGPATMITSTVRGWGPIESPDGKYIYFLKSPPKSGSLGISLWRMSPTGTDEERVIDYLPTGGNFTLTDEGIFYAAAFSPPWSIRFLDTATGKSRDISTSPNFIFCPTASPDGRSLVWAQTDSSGSDIMLVENFR
jgi:serine/threonine protein kinase/dipeptidyl aminopeptidase/acylaminoacyl peptidase